MDEEGTESGRSTRAQGVQGVDSLPAGGVHKPHVVVLGNEKGGSGKTTAAMHLIVLLLQEGARVGSIDLDTRQRSLTRYVENRRVWSSASGVRLKMPNHFVLQRVQAETVQEVQDLEKAAFEEAMMRLERTCDFIIIDSPGTDTYLSRLGHAAADTLVTPVNDSFVDVDLLGSIDPQTYRVKGLSLYSEMVWESRKKRALKIGGTIDWVVMRNRLSHLDAKNKRRVQTVLEVLAERVGFRLAPGFGERVIFREMFPSGLTLLDLRDDGVSTPLSLSHVVARTEVRTLLDVLGLQTPLRVRRAAQQARAQKAASAASASSATPHVSSSSVTPSSQATPSQGASQAPSRALPS